MQRSLCAQSAASFFISMLLTVLLVITSACGGAPMADRPAVDTTDTRAKPLLELAREVPEIGQFRRALEMTAHREALEATGPFTMLAPVDRAFLAFIRRDSAVVADLADTLETIIGLHLVRGDLDDVWGDSLVVSTVSEGLIVLRRTNGRLTVQDKPVLARLVAQNGILYVISDGIEPTPPDTSRPLLEEQIAPV